MRLLSEKDYIDLVYGQKSDKPWLILMGNTPYGAPAGDFSVMYILLKRIICAKLAWGDAVNVAFMDVYQSEYVRKAFDPDISRMGENCPMVIYVKDGIVHHLNQANHEAVALSNLIKDGTGII